MQAGSETGAPLHVIPLVAVSKCAPRKNRGSARGGWQGNRGKGTLIFKSDDRRTIDSFPVLCSSRSVICPLTHPFTPLHSACMSKPSSNRVIRLRGVRHNNLKNFDLDLPLNQLVVITGLSGSGKSSLAFDTLFAEGQ